jgi:hypothetical protein
MTLPTFLILGTSHAGTTSLYDYLDQHPEVFMSPIKEPAFFIFDGVPKSQIPENKIGQLDMYKQLFSGVSHHKAVGDATPAYLFDERALKNIQHYVPKAKMIVVLRDPVDRAFSHFLHVYMKDSKTYLEDFVRGFQTTPQSRYVQMGFYSSQLKGYFDHFQPDQFKIFLFDDVKKDSLFVAKQMFDFLEVDTHFSPNVDLQRNKSGIPKHALLKALLPYRSNLRKYIPRFLADRLKQSMLERPILPDNIRKQLIETYREDILKLQSLIHRDLSAWLL